MQYRGRHIKITELDIRVYNDLVNELSKDSDWKKVAEQAARSYKEPRKKWIDDLERRSNLPISRLVPADLLLTKLASRLCNVGTLCDFLKSCELIYALYVIIGIEKLIITKQPYSEEDGTPYEAEVDDRISIPCIATGVPSPQYQWYHGNVEIPGQTSSILCLPITSPDQEGEYQCRVSQYNRDGKLLHDEYSNCAPLKIRPTPVEIIRHSLSCKVKLGNILTLNCEARSHPIPRFQWYKDDVKLPKKNSDTLRIKNFQHKDTGKYHCLVWNENGEKITGEIDVKVDDPPRKATAKIALIIANSNYQYLKELPLAVKDANSLTTELQAMDFQVILMYNLTLNEMKAAVELFCTALVADSYGLFYFVGHGCMIEDYHMLPIDIPENFHEQQTFSQQHFLNAAQKQRPALLVGILDMCLKEYPEARDPTWQEELPKTCRSKCYDSLVLAYPTCSYRPSYEPVGEKNGFYMSHLREHINKKKPAYELFQEVATAVERSTTHKTCEQKPLLITVPGTPNRCLTDAVDCPKMLQNHRSFVTELISFRPQVVELAFPRCGISFSVTIQPLNPPCLNVMELITSGLEKWEVRFCISPHGRVGLSSTERSCILYNLQRASKETLMIQIKQNEMPYAVIHFPFRDYIPAIVRGL